MAKYFFILLFSVFTQLASAQSDSLNCANCTAHELKIFQHLQKIDFNKYYNKKVSVFFKTLNAKYEKYILSMAKPGFISKVIFVYSDSLSIDISVSNLGQKEKLNFNYKFDIQEFSTKNISMICVRYGGTCIKGCKAEYCY